MLIERFFKDPENKRILFVRNRDGNIPHLDRDTTPMDKTTFEQLYNLLEELFPHSQISLLVTNCPIFPGLGAERGIYYGMRLSTMMMPSSSPVHPGDGKKCF